MVQPVDRAVGGETFRRVTYADIARAAGVSKATVSYVLNDTADRRISPSTRELVIDTAKRLGHVPFAPARALSSGTSNLVLILIPGYTIGQLFGEGLQRLDDSLASHGYALLVHSHSGAGRTLRDLWALISPTSVIVVGATAAREVRSTASPQTALVDLLEMIDNVAIGRMQAEYLASKGHSTMGFLVPNDPAVAVFAQERLRGIRQVCNERGFSAPLITRIPSTDAALDATIVKWRSGARPVTAICAHNDEAALALLPAIDRLGLTYPDDVAIIGVDDVPLARIGLTTIAIRNAEVWGQMASKIASGTMSTAHEPVPADSYLKLIVRETA